MYYESYLIDPMKLLEQAAAYASLAAVDQFYRIPIFMMLLTHLRQTIHEGTGRTMFGNSVTYLPTEYEFTAEDMSGGNVIINMDNKALGVIDADGVQWPFEAEEVSYLSGNIYCLLSRIIGEHSADAWSFADDATEYEAAWSIGSNLLSVTNPTGLQVGMAVEGVTGIQAGTRITEINGGIVTINKVSTAAGDTTLTMAWPTFEGTWKVVLTGNVVDTESE